MPDTELLINVLEDDRFLDNKRDLEAAEIYARDYVKDEPIEGEEEAGKVADAISDLMTALDRAEEDRRATTQAWWDSKKHVDSNYKELEKKPEAALAFLKRRALAFKQARERRIAREQREAQEKLDREAEAKAEEAQAAAELAAEEPDNPEARQLHAQAHHEAAAAAVATAPTPPPPRQVRGSFGKLGARAVYRHTVTDVTALPPECITWNDKAIKALIKGEAALAKAQERPFNLDLIPGVVIVAEEIPVGGSAVRS